MFGILKNQTQSKLFQLRQVVATCPEESERSHLSSDVLLRPMYIFREESKQLCIIFLKGSRQTIKISKHFIFNHCYKILSAPLNALRQQNIPRSNWKQGGWKDDETVQWHWHSKTIDFNKLSLLFVERQVGKIWELVFWFFFNSSR